MIIEDNNGNSYRQLDWIDRVGTLGPLTPTIAYIAANGAIYGAGGRLLAAARAEQAADAPDAAGFGGAATRIEAAAADARRDDTRQADARRVRRINEARSSLATPRRHGDRPGLDRRSFCR